MPQVDRAALSSEDEVMEMAGKLKWALLSWCVSDDSTQQQWGLVRYACSQLSPIPAAWAGRLTQDAALRKAAVACALWLQQTNAAVAAVSPRIRGSAHQAKS